MSPETPGFRGKNIIVSEDFPVYCAADCLAVAINTFHGGKIVLGGDVFRTCLRYSPIWSSTFDFGNIVMRFATEEQHDIGWVEVEGGSQPVEKNN